MMFSFPRLTCGSVGRDQLNSLRGSCGTACLRPRSLSSSGGKDVTDPGKSSGSARRRSKGHQNNLTVVVVEVLGSPVERISPDDLHPWFHGSQTSDFFRVSTQRT